MKNVRLGHKIVFKSNFDYLKSNEIYTVDYLSHDTVGLHNELTGGGTYLERWRFKEALNDAIISSGEAI